MSRARAGVLLTLVAMITSAAFGQAGVADRVVVFSHVTVVDVTAGVLQSDRTVLIRNGRIDDIVAGPVGGTPADALVVEARGKYLIPGLWDMHVHTVFGDWLPRNEKVTLPLFVANGV